MVGKIVPGKVVTASLSTMKYGQTDEWWLITRGGPDVEGTARRRDLSPARSLFIRCHTEWKAIPKEDWWTEYVQAFAQQFEHADMKAALRELYRRVKSGSTIGLICYCPDPAYCHRGLISDFLRRYDITVQEVARPRSLPPPDPQLRFAWGEGDE